MDRTKTRPTQRPRVNHPLIPKNTEFRILTNCQSAEAAKKRAYSRRRAPPPKYCAAATGGGWSRLKSKIAPPEDRRRVHQTCAIDLFILTIIDSEWTHRSSTRRSTSWLGLEWKRAWHAHLSSLSPARCDMRRPSFCQHER